MFSKAGQQPVSGPGRDAGRSVISSDVRIEGSLATDGVLEFDGQISGDLHAHALGVGRAARVDGNVSGTFVTVDGTVDGDITATTLTLKPTAVVAGALSYVNVTVESGAVVNGRFTRLPEPATIEGPGAALGADPGAEVDATAPADSARPAPRRTAEAG